MKGELGKRKSPSVGGDHERERSLRVLWHFLFPAILHNVGLINPRKCGIISPSLGVKMKWELIDQVYTMTEIIMLFEGGSACSNYPKHLAAKITLSLSDVILMLFSLSAGLSEKGLEVMSEHTAQDYVWMWWNPGDKLALCMLFSSLFVCSEPRHKALDPICSSKFPVSSHLHHKEPFTL